MKKLILGITLLFSISQAGIYTRENIIISSPYHLGFVEKNIYNNHVYYPNRQKNRYHHKYKNRRAINILIGGLIGGIIGNQLDSGRGPGAISGMIIGTIAGSSLSHSRRRDREYSYCGPQNSRFERHMMRHQRRFFRHRRENYWRYHHTNHFDHQRRRYPGEKHLIIIRDY